MFADCTWTDCQTRPNGKSMSQDLGPKKLKLKWGEYGPGVT